MTNSFPPIEELAPHRGSMLLIDRVIHFDEYSIQCETIIRSQNIFFAPGAGAPSYVGLELMAQTISAYDGMRLHSLGQEPKIGLLLGCRSYSVQRAHFREQERLVIQATCLLGESAMASFDCRIFNSQEDTLAIATINVYRPDNLDLILRLKN